MAGRLNNTNIRNVRLRTIAHMLRTRVIAGQEELLQVLMMQGIETTQATLSRDLRDLRAEKRTMADGTVRYIVPEEPAQPRVRAIQSELLRQSMQSVDVCAPFVVVKTKQGYAGVAAKEIENQAPERVLGTIAGEDTILVILREQSDPQQLRDLLRAAMQ